MPSVPGATDLRARVSSWLHRSPKVEVRRTILVADANAPNRRALTRLIESLGYDALQTSSLDQALAQLETQDPQCVLLGFQLDDTTGLDALKQLRELDSDLAVIMLADDLWDQRVAEALRHGAVAYLARPYGMNDLREVLGRS